MTDQPQPKADQTEDIEPTVPNTGERVEDYVRLSVNISYETAGKIQKYRRLNGTEDKPVNATLTVARAIDMLDYIDQARSEGYEIVFRRGGIQEVVVFPW